MADPLDMAAGPGASLGSPPALSKVAIFWRRLMSSVLLWALVIGVMFVGPKTVADYVFLVSMMLIAGVGLAEFYHLVERRNLACFKLLGIGGGLTMMASTFVYLSGQFGDVVASKSPAQANSFETCLLILFVLGLCVRQFLSRRNAMGIVAISTTLFGLMYVPWLLNFIQKINYYPFADPRSGRFYILYFIAITKFSDLGAYVVGSLLGRHKMIPRISPGKTWEGFGGALLGSTLVSVWLAHWAGEQLVGMSLGHAVVLGLVLGAAAVLGDLIESLFKREAGVKDSGRLFPGMGGMLDLLDSLLFNAPLMYLYLRYILNPLSP